MKITKLLKTIMLAKINKLIISSFAIAATANPKYIFNDLTVNGLLHYFGAVLFFASLLIIFASKGLRIILFVLLFFVSSISVFGFIYNIPELDAISIFTIFSHAKTLSTYYIDWTNLLTLALLAFVLFVSIKIPGRFNFGYKIWTLSFIFAVVWIAVERNAVPGSYISKSGYLWEVLNRNIAPIDLTLENKFEYKDVPDYVVLIRTDSVRSDYWNLINKSEQSFLGKEYGVNLISFPNVYSLRANTNTSLGYIFTRYRGLDDSYAFEEKSFIHIFNRLGFSTHYMSVNDQEIGTPTTNPAALFALESESVWNNKNTPRIEGNYFGLLTGSGQRGVDSIPHVQFLKLLNEGRLKKPSLIVISHCCDGHIAWDFFPENEIFTRYKPYCIPKSGKFSHCSSVEIVNAYKNSLLYTDYLTASVLKALENSKSIVFGTSDHGQALGEFGLFGHGISTSQQPTGGYGNDFLHNVATFVWASDEFIRHNETKWNSLRENSLNRYDHSFVFHSILDCSGITSFIIDLKKSICAR